MKHKKSHSYAFSACVVRSYFMKSKFFKATPGHGSTDLDYVMNEWLSTVDIEIITMTYSSHIEDYETRSGFKNKRVAYTVIILYRDLV